MSYFVTFNQFGFSPTILNRLLIVPYFHHNPTDIYDPAHPTLGNTNLKCDGATLTEKDGFGRPPASEGNYSGSTLDWLFLADLY